MPDSLEIRASQVGQVRDIQEKRKDQSWYDCGLYNGLEVADSILEARDPDIYSISGGDEDEEE